MVSKLLLRKLQMMHGVGTVKTRNGRSLKWWRMIHMHKSRMYLQAAFVLSLSQVQHLERPVLKPKPSPMLTKFRGLILYKSGWGNQYPLPPSVSVANSLSICRSPRLRVMRMNMIPPALCAKFIFDHLWDIWVLVRFQRWTCKSSLVL